MVGQVQRSFAQRHRPPGWLADNEGELAQAITALCNDGSRQPTMAVEAKKLSHRFDIRDITSQWIELYEEAIMAVKKVNE